MPVSLVRVIAIVGFSVVEETEGGHLKCQLFQLSSSLKLASISDITQEDGTPR